jgi:DNA-binding NarL/FixJ family response regulator
MARVLLIDHTGVIRDHVRTVLTRDGLDVCGDAADGRQGIEEARRLKPDIVILDYSLPELSGAQGAYEIRQFLSNVKIVFFTVHDEATISSAARVIGAHAFVSKSSIGELVLAVRRLAEEKEPVGFGPTTGLPAPNSPPQNPAAKRASPGASK